MPKISGIDKVMIIGSGPIIIGQACEFDYSGTQACKALREMGYEIVLVNSNPATIMTDPEMADQTYIEPLNLEQVTKIIAKERPDALLPNLGGQTALNLASELETEGVLEEYGVKVIGVQLDAIKRGEDRTTFKETMNSLGIEMPESTTVYTVEDAEAFAAEQGYPVVIRPAYTMGGTGGGLVFNVEELRTVAGRGIAASRINQILVEESVLGWQELELEVVRDVDNNMITVCFIENVDPMGVHTGDSFCTAPMLTISEELQARLQDCAHRIVEAIEVIGGTNVQMAYNPEDDRLVVIEINPRTSRSSALASKATGFPIALISAKLAGGLKLRDIPYWRDGTLDKYTPSGDYVVVKFPRWAFEKFKKVEDKLGTQMRAVGEVMSIGKNYKEAFLKAVRSLENGRHGLGFAKNFNSLAPESLLENLKTPSSERHFMLYEALRKGVTVETLHNVTKVTPWFLEQMRELVEREVALLEYRGGLPPEDLLLSAKVDGFSDRYLAEILMVDECDVRAERKRFGIVQGWEKVPVSGVENSAYYYSSYSARNESLSSDRRKVMVLGGGPNRIGQGIEFDYCCVHAALSLRDMGYETIMVNCNPETVSTDYDTSDKLYFEPLTVEDVLSIYEHEQPEGVIVQFGGQTPLNIAAELKEAGVTVLGTSPETIDLAEDRDLFRNMMDKLEIPMPEAGMAASLEEAHAVAARIGYPLMLRPSYVLGGRGMEVVYEEAELEEYMAAAVDVSPRRPILIDKFLEDAIEAEADAICDGSEAFVPAVMEHVELAGIHSGDSACVLPPENIPDHIEETIIDYTARIAKEMRVVGLMNIQYAICAETVYVLEANPRASRTVPLVSKVCGISMAKIATELMMGRRLSELNLKRAQIDYRGVKESVFPFHMFQEVDPILGPEMRSTGEVLGLGDDFGTAFYKAQEATSSPLPLHGNVLITIAEKDRQRDDRTFEIAQMYRDLGFTVMATRGTRDYLVARGIECRLALKNHEGRPDIVDAIKNGDIQLVINTPSGKMSMHDDSYIRKNAIRYCIPYITTLAAARAAAMGIRALTVGEGCVRSIQEYHKQLVPTN